MRAREAIRNTQMHEGTKKHCSHEIENGEAWIFLFRPPFESYGWKEPLRKPTVAALIKFLETAKHPVLRTLANPLLIIYVAARFGAYEKLYLQR